MGAGVGARDRGRRFAGRRVADGWPARQVSEVLDEPRMMLREPHELIAPQADRAGPVEVAAQDQASAAPASAGAIAAVHSDDMVDDLSGWTIN